MWWLDRQMQLCLRLSPRQNMKRQRKSWERLQSEHKGQGFLIPRSILVLTYNTQDRFKSSSFLKILLPDLSDSDQFEFRNPGTIVFPCRPLFDCGSRFSTQLFLNVLIRVVFVFVCIPLCASDILLQNLAHPFLPQLHHIAWYCNI